MRITLYILCILSGFGLSLRTREKKLCPTGSEYWSYDEETDSCLVITGSRLSFQSAKTTWCESYYESELVTIENREMDDLVEQIRSDKRVESVWTMNPVRENPNTKSPSWQIWTTSTPPDEVSSALWAVVKSEDGWEEQRKSERSRALCHAKTGINIQCPAAEDNKNYTVTLNVPQAFEKAEVTWNVANDLYDESLRCSYGDSQCKSSDNGLSMTLSRRDTQKTSVYSYTSELSLPSGSEELTVTAAMDSSATRIDPVSWKRTCSPKRYRAPSKMICSQSHRPGEPVEISCKTPKVYPEAKCNWTRDGQPVERINEDGLILVSHDHGHFFDDKILLFKSTCTMTDTSDPGKRGNSTYMLVMTPNLSSLNDSQLQSARQVQRFTPPFDQTTSTSGTSPSGNDKDESSTPSGQGSGDGRIEEENTGDKNSSSLHSSTPSSPSQSKTVIIIISGVLVVLIIIACTFNVFVLCQMYKDQKSPDSTKFDLKLFLALARCSWPPDGSTSTSNGQS